MSTTIIEDYLNYEKASQDVFLPFGEAERNRLVKAAKSPTHEILLTEALKKGFKGRVRMPRPLSLPAQAEGPFSHLGGREESIQATDKFNEKYTNEVGCKTIIQFREWSDEWRIMTRVDGTVSSPPPLQAGDRISKMLSNRAARKISDSCSYMASQSKGFQTFVTGTFSQEARDRIDAGETTIQKEVTRTMDAMTKMYQRGWDTTREARKYPVMNNPSPIAGWLKSLKTIAVK